MEYPCLLLLKSTFSIFPAYAHLCSFKTATKRSLSKASGCPTQMPAEATVPGMAMCYTVLGNGATRNSVSSFKE